MNEKNHTSISISTGTMFRAVLVVVLSFTAWYLRDLIMVILTSVAISAFVESAVPRFKKIGVGRVTGIALLYVVALSILSALFYLFAPLLITEVYNFATFLSSYIPNSPIINFFQNDAFSGAKDIVANLPKNISISTLLDTSHAFVSNISGGFFSTISVAFGSILNVILIVVISFYISIRENGVEEFLRTVIPAKNEEYIVSLWKRTQRKISLWMKGQMLLAVLIAVLTYLVLSLLGIQYALLLSIIAGFMELVPYGILVALVPAVFFSYISGGAGSALMVFGAYLIIHQFDIFLFSPLIIKRVVGLSPLAMILSVLIGLELGGFWGLILSIPVAVLLMEILSDIGKKKTLSKNKE